MTGMPPAGGWPKATWPAFAFACALACGTTAGTPGGPDPSRADGAVGGAPGSSDAAVSPPPGTGTGGQAGPAPGPLVDAGPAAPGPPIGLRPVPARFIVLGDSIAACQGVGEKDSPTCGPKKLHAYLAAGPAPILTYENLAIAGADTADVPGKELGKVASGRGHALVLIYVGGNDLRPYLIGPDAAAESGLARVLPQIEADWKKIFSFFADKTRFPDGATLLMNNQYNPFDGCTAPPYFVSPKKHQLLGAYNQALARLAQESQESGVFLTDQFTPYLGHGHHYAAASCPHYQKGATPFMNDLIHPNAAGHDHLFTQWRAIVDRFYATRP